MIVKRRTAVVTVGISAVLGIVAGSGLVAYAGDESTSVATSETPGPLATNESGQTYGSWDVRGDEPELVEVTADSGQPGYIYVRDVKWEPASSPEEAARMMEQRVNSNGDVVVPVYKADGKTKIGEFTAGHVDAGGAGQND